MRNSPLGAMASGAGRAGIGCGAQLGGLVLSLALAALLLTTLVRTFDPIEREARATAAWRAQQMQNDLYYADLWAGYAWRLVPAAAAGVLLCGLSGVLVLIAYRQFAAWQTIRMDRTIRLKRAETMRFPEGLQTLSFHDSSRAAPALAEPLAPLPELMAPAVSSAPELPSFAQLLDQGRVGRGNPMLLGYDAEGAPVEGSWLDLYSCGLGGLSGSGKSWTAVFLAAQAALFGTRIVLLDPHAADPESLTQRLAPLSGRYLCAPAESPREMLAAVELVAEELRQRKAGRRGEPLLFIADEYSALQRGELAEPLGQLVEALGQEGRKLGLYGLVAGQVWTASRAGGTEVRDSLASAYVHRCRPAQARYLTGLTADSLPADLLELPKGTAYLLSTSGELRRVTIPRMAAGDVGRVAQLLAPASPSATPLPERRIGFRPEGASEGASEGAIPPPLRRRPDAANLTADEAKIVAGFLSGKTVTELASELAGGKRSGDAYMRAAAIVAAALRKALGKGAGDA